MLLVRESWRSVEPFAGDLQKLFATLASAVKDLERLEAGTLRLQPVRAGVRPPYYDAIGAALLSVVGAGMGSSFTPEVKKAWRTLYGRLAAAMQKENA